MDEQGRSTFSEDQNGRILDRLAGLEKVISQEQITNALKVTNKQSVRRCKLTNEIMILVVLAMGLFTELPIRQVFKASRKIRTRPAAEVKGRFRNCGRSASWNLAHILNLPSCMVAGRIPKGSWSKACGIRFRSTLC